MIVKYFSEDGREFSSPEDCRSYEMMLKTIQDIPKKVFDDFQIITNEKGEDERWYKINSPLDLYYFDIVNSDIPQNKEELIYNCIELAKRISSFPLFLKKSKTGRAVSLQKMLEAKIEQYQELKVKFEAIVDYIAQINSVLNPVDDQEYDELPFEDEIVTPPQPEDTSADAHISVLTNDLPKEDMQVVENKSKGRKKKSDV
jgi:hypothetical protein